MKIFSFICILIFLIIPPDPFTDAGLDKTAELFFRVGTILKLLPFKGSIFKEVIELWNFPVGKLHEISGGFLFRDKHAELLEHIQRISSDMSDLEQEIQNQAQINTAILIQSFPKILNSELQLHELTSIINQINFGHDKLEEYFTYHNFTRGRGEENGNSSDSNKSLISESNSNIEFESPSKQKEDRVENDINVSQMSRGFIKRARHSKRFIEKYTLEDFATWATGHGSNSLMALLRKLNDLIVTKDGSGLFNIMKENLVVRFNILNFCESIMAITTIFQEFRDKSFLKMQKSGR